MTLFLYSVLMKGISLIGTHGETEWSSTVRSSEHISFLMIFGTHSRFYSSDKGAMLLLYSAC